MEIFHGLSLCFNYAIFLWHTLAMNSCLKSSYIAQADDSSHRWETYVLVGALYEAKLRQRDLIPVLGASSVISDILNGKRSISKTHARKLAEFFHVLVSLLI
jgi:hypothetical protein